LLHQVLEAKTPQAVLAVEGEDARVDSRYDFLTVFENFYSAERIDRMIKDERIKGNPSRSIFAQDTTDRIG
jgi:hypothetical protein